MIPTGRFEGRTLCSYRVAYPVIRHSAKIRVGAKTCHDGAAALGSTDFRESGERDASDFIHRDGRGYSVGLDVNLDGKVDNDDLALVRARVGR